MVRYRYRYLLINVDESELLLCPLGFLPARLAPPTPEGDAVLSPF
jgi:hypothetical protein